MEVTAPRLDEAAGFVRIFLFPLRCDEEVGFDFEQSLEDQGETVRGRFLEGEDLDVVIVQPQKPAMAFQVGLAEVVQKGVVFQPRVLDLNWR